MAHPFLSFPDIPPPILLTGQSADLGGADLEGAKNILTAMADGWPMFAIRWEDGIRIKAGCHWFTVAEARAYWGAMIGVEREQHGKLMLIGVDALVMLAEAHWGKESKDG